VIKHGEPDTKTTYRTVRRQFKKKKTIHKNNIQNCEETIQEEEDNTQKQIRSSFRDKNEAGMKKEQHIYNMRKNEVSRTFKNHEIKIKHKIMLTCR